LNTSAGKIEHAVTVERKSPAIQREKIHFVMPAADTNSQPSTPVSPTTNASNNYSIESVFDDKVGRDKFRQYLLSEHNLGMLYLFVTYTHQQILIDMCVRTTVVC
jgi:hypothetical protein